MLSLSKKEPTSLEVLAKNFEVQELEERLEFAKWELFVEGDSNGTVKGGAKVSF